LDFAKAFRRISTQIEHCWYSGGVKPFQPVLHNKTGSRMVFKSTLPDREKALRQDNYFRKPKQFDLKPARIWLFGDQLTPGFQARHNFSTIS